MQVNQERIMGHIDALSHFNATPDAGITRFSYSPQDAQARAYLMDRFTDLADPCGPCRKCPGQICRQ